MTSSMLIIEKNLTDDNSLIISISISSPSLLPFRPTLHWLANEDFTSVIMLGSSWQAEGYSVLKAMEHAGRNDRPSVLKPFSSPNLGDLLRKRIGSWSKETSMPTSVLVHVEGKIFHLHESPLVLKSGYFRKALAASSEIELPESFPGGSEAFEMAMLFSYHNPLPLDPFNVLSLRCAGSFLEMTEEYSSGNLCEQVDLYLNQVVLQSWDDTLIVLQKCQIFLPWAEELLVVSRCIESLAFMACMEILDPEQQRKRPVLSLQAIVGHAWSCEAVKEIAGQELWVKALIALPFEFFKRIIGSLRRQGMEEKYVSPLVIFYANKWVLSKKTHKYWESRDENNGDDTSLNKKGTAILQGLLELLPLGDKTSPAIPVAFYFAMLSRSLSLGLEVESRMGLEDQVASLLHFAQVEDFLLPASASGAESIASSAELKVMERIISLHVSSKRAALYSRSSPLNINSMVAELWDSYLSCIARDPKLETARFIELLEIVPMADRESHDNLYRTISAYLQEHPHLSSEDKAAVCRNLNCQKLSQPMCIQAVQNELMPLRLIVQALSVQQLHTNQAFKDFSESFRYTQLEYFSGSLPGSRSQAPLSQYLGESPYQQEAEEANTGGEPLASLLKRDHEKEEPELTKAEYESTSFRIQVLEEELMTLKKRLKRQNVTKGPDCIASRTPIFQLFDMERKMLLERRSPSGHVSSCFGSISWISQRKHVNRLLKAFRRIRMLGKGKTKKKEVSSGIKSSSVACKSQIFNENV